MPISTALFGQVTPEQRAARQAMRDALDAANTALKNGKYDEAQSAFQRLYDRGPQSAGFGYSGAVEGLADVYSARRDYRNALAKYRELCYPTREQMWGTSRTNEPEVRFKFAIALYEVGEYDEALTNFNEGLKYVRKHLGLSVEDMQLPLNAQTVRTKRLPAAAHLGIAAQKIDFDEDGALSHAREAVRLYPNSAGARSLLGYLLRRKGTRERDAASLDEATRELVRATELGNPALKRAADREIYFATATREALDKPKEAATP